MIRQKVKKNKVKLPLGQVKRILSIENININMMDYDFEIHQYEGKFYWRWNETEWYGPFKTASAAFSDCNAR